MTEFTQLSAEQAQEAKNAFHEGSRAAEAEAAASPTGERQRDEQGRFVAPDAPVVDEPAVEEVAPVEPVAVETPDERDARIAALEARLAEKDEFIGRQSSEVGELRQRLDSFDERLNTPQTPRQSITQEMVEQNPGAAAQLAYEQGDQYTLSAAYENWKIEDPASAATWIVTKQAESKERELRAEYDKKFTELESRFTPIAARNTEQELQQGVQALSPETRAFLSDAPTVEALASEFPTIGRVIANAASPSGERLEAVRALYDIHRGRISDTLQLSAQEAARTTAEEAQAMRDESYVASATTPPEQAKSWEQQEQEKALAGFNRPRDTWDAAFVRPAKK